MGVYMEEKNCIYEKIKNDINSNYYQNNYSNNGQMFLAWYLRNVHNLDEVETKDCITDGPNDKQIDAIYIDNAKSTIYIIQGKFYGGEKVDAQPLREVLSSWVQIKDLAKLQDAANYKLKTKIAELSSAIDDDYDIVFELIITAKLSQSAQNDLEAFTRELSECETLNASLSIIDKDVLKFKYEENIGNDSRNINHTFIIDKSNYITFNFNGTKAIIAAIPLKECINIPGIKDTSLFRRNVRQSLGLSNKVNKGIAKSLKDDSSDFFFYHNVLV